MTNIRTTSTTPVASDFTSTEGTPVVVDESTDIPYYSKDNVPTPLQATGGKRYITTTVTLDFPSVAANNMEVLNVTLTGVRANDDIFLGPPAGMEAGFTWCGVCISDDTVEVRIHNNNGGAVNPPSATWRVSAFI